ncbi:AAEL017568-PA [Aedes aegypti]|uniref:AAEL017568-PA n=1 Tax=Aedes aegypti TaxID=7159 RepID=J9HS78_AEDAE|nr:AAEL017568-PA [Aedes aegypti]
MDCILMENVPVQWSDVAGLGDAKEALTEAPPGTGKTYLAKAVASQASNASFFFIASSDLVSRWMGKSEKLIRSVFELALARQPSIICIDDVDMLCLSRLDNENVRKIKNELLISIQEEGGNEIFVIGATNAPWLLDADIRTCFEKCIRVPLPEENARLMILKQHLGNMPGKLTEECIRTVANNTKDYSGADIVLVARDALMQPVRKIQSSTHFRKISSMCAGNEETIPEDFLVPSKKSGKKSDGGSDQGVGSYVDPLEKQLEEEQLAKEKAFAKQMAARKKLLARQKAWKEEQLKQEREMRELELQVQREMEEQQLQHEQEMLDAQLAAERDFMRKRDAIRKQFASSVNRVNALKDQEGAVGGASADNPKQKVHEWLDEQTEIGKLPSAADFRGAYPKERLREIERQKLCGVCLNKHNGNRCLSKIRCVMRNCQGAHHPLLHRVEESVQLQKAKLDCIVIFRMMPVTLYVGKRQFDTVAFLDEGSSATLVDDVVAKRLKPLIVTWTENINSTQRNTNLLDNLLDRRETKQQDHQYRL